MYIKVCYRKWNGDWQRGREYTFEYDLEVPPRRGMIVEVPTMDYDTMIETPKFVMITQVDIDINRCAYRGPFKKVSRIVPQEELVNG